MTYISLCVHELVRLSPRSLQNGIAVPPLPKKNAHRMVGFFFLCKVVVMRLFGGNMGEVILDFRSVDIL